MKRLLICSDVLGYFLGGNNCGVAATVAAKPVRSVGA